MFPRGLRLGIAGAIGIGSVSRIVGDLQKENYTNGDRAGQNTNPIAISMFNFLPKNSGFKFSERAKDDQISFLGSIQSSSLGILQSVCGTWVRYCECSDEETDVKGEVLLMKNASLTQESIELERVEKCKESRMKWKDFFRIFSFAKSEKKNDEILASVNFQENCKDTAPQISESKEDQDFNGAHKTSENDNIRNSVMITQTKNGETKKKILSRKRAENVHSTEEGRRVKEDLREDGDGGEGEVVLITGGSGFLGQHIVSVLQEFSTGVKEIRVFDRRPYSSFIDYKQTVPVISVLGDITDLNQVREAMSGVTAVVHTAGAVSFGTFPNIHLMEKVNVQGTANVIQACVEQNVNKLVYTSTVDVVIGYDHVVNGDESLSAPEKFLFKGYPDTKHRAERLVIEAHGRKLERGDGSILNTLALRPSVMYGEGDPYYVTEGLKSASQAGGILYRVGNGRALFQQAYAGNVAWGHVCALAALSRNPGGSGGRPYFITDDTPLLNSFEFMRPFLELRGFGLSSRSIPYPLVYTAYLIIDTFLGLIRPFYEINLSTALPSVVYVNRTLYFNRQRAEELLGYKPLYSYRDSIKRFMPFYKNVKLD